MPQRYKIPAEFAIYAKACDIPDGAICACRHENLYHIAGEQSEPISHSIPCENISHSAKDEYIARKV